MQSFIILLFWLLIVSSLVYTLIIFEITIGWFRIKNFREQTDSGLPDVSIVAAVRNESNAIEKLLKDLVQQNYPSGHFEIMLVDDHSEDNTFELTERFISNNTDFDINLIHSEGNGKKAAVSEGVKLAKHELIVTTDGDCSVNDNWLKRLAEYHELKKPKLIVGSVVYNHKKGFLQHFFNLEFMSLVASGAGSLGMGVPLMANGANLSFTKKTYKDVLSTQDGKTLTSGDDVFLLHAISKKFGSKTVHFIKDSLTIVETDPPENIKIFFSQRSRWASKAIAYRSWWAILVSITVFMFNLFLVLCLVASLLKPWMLIIYGLFVLLKILIDFPLLYYFSEFANRKKSIPYLFLFGWIYPIYIVVAACSSLLFRFSWKGRRNLK